MLDAVAHCGLSCDCRLFFLVGTAEELFGDEFSQIGIDLVGRGRFAAGSDDAIELRGGGQAEAQLVPIGRALFDRFKSHSSSSSISTQPLPPQTRQTSHCRCARSYWSHHSLMMVAPCPPQVSHSAFSTSALHTLLASAQRVDEARVFGSRYFFEGLRADPFEHPRVLIETEGCGEPFDVFDLLGGDARRYVDRCVVDCLGRVVVGLLAADQPL